MIISDVTIKNFKGIEEIKMDFKPGFNLIKGINGKGKTSILEAIAVGLGGFVARMPWTINGTKGSDDTCDTHKGSESIKINPLDQSTLRHINYSSATGAIFSQDTDIEKDINVTLNLNSKPHMLKENRKKKLNACILEMSRLQKNGIWNRKMLEKMYAVYEDFDSEGKRMEYAGIVLWYLKKRLKY